MCVFVFLCVGIEQVERSLLKVYIHGTKERKLTPRQLRACVIGAGAAGLVSVKELLEQGHEVVCYEKYHDLGGVFLYDGEEG